jgi:hypothetical protein
VALLCKGLVTADSLLSRDVLFAFGSSRRAVIEQRAEVLISHSRRPEKVDLIETAIQPAPAAAEAEPPSRVI